MPKKLLALLFPTVFVLLVIWLVSQIQMNRIWDAYYRLDGPILVHSSDVETFNLDEENHLSLGPAFIPMAIDMIPKYVDTIFVYSCTTVDGEGIFYEEIAWADRNQVLAECLPRDFEIGFFR
jgi:hypothetical protein